MKTKKILVVTLYGAVNHGNILQHYALKTVLQTMGYIVTSAKYKDKRKPTAVPYIKNVVKRFLMVFGFTFENSIRLSELNIKLKRTSRFKAFLRTFIKNYIFFDFDEIETDKAIKIANEYDFIVTGSDQVWHHWYKDSITELPYFYLEFAPKEKTISYAASFGFSQFEACDLDAHRKGLCHIGNLSVRDENMVPLIMNAVGIVPKIVIDPTLLLEQKEWNKLQKKPDYISNKRYILVYFLGEQTQEHKCAINTFQSILQEKLGIEISIVDILNPSYKEYYLTTPDEFIYLINHAEVILTDSFHACVFSVLYHKNFLAFKRKGQNQEDMYGRINGLLNELGIKDHEFVRGIYNLPTLPDYDVIEEKLVKLRRDSIEWLKKSIMQE